MATFKTTRRQILKQQEGDYLNNKKVTIKTTRRRLLKQKDGNNCNKNVKLTEN